VVIDGTLYARLTFAELSGCTVAKNGKIVTPCGDVVGRLVSGDPKILFGRLVDEDGHICDKNGNVLGRRRAGRGRSLRRRRKLCRASASTARAGW
jgi:hypothetical protein